MPAAAAAASNKSEIQLRRRRKTSDDGDDLNNRPAARKRRTRRLKNDDDNQLPCLPHEVVVCNILNRLPVKSLMRFNCVSKLWYDSIHKDQNFASFHLNQSLQNPPLMFHIVNVMIHILNAEPHNRNQYIHPLFVLDDQKKDREIYPNEDGADLVFRNLISLSTECVFEQVGTCNGLVCLSNDTFLPRASIMIINPSMSESLFLYLTTRDHGYIVCYGFGYDSLTKEYKVVVIVCNNFGVGKSELKCLIFTLGGNNNNNNSWRETSTRPPIRSGIIKQYPFYKSAIFCGGLLFWRTRYGNMLLSFDLHEEKFQAYLHPTGCYSKSTEPVVDPLIQFRGSPCVPHIENIGGGCDGLRQHFDCKVHFHILIMGKVKKLWTKETFDVHISSPSLHSPVAPCCCFYGTTTPAPTRIFSSSDQVLLYWFNGEYLQFYNLHTKHLKVVKCPCYDDHRWVFRNKEHHSFPAGKDARNRLRPVDYRLNHHVENLFSLQTLIPRGAPKLDYDDMLNLNDGKEKQRRPAAGYVFVLCTKKIIILLFIKLAS